MNESQIGALDLRLQADLRQLRRSRKARKVRGGAAAPFDDASRGWVRGCSGFVGGEQTGSHKEMSHGCDKESRELPGRSRRGRGSWRWEGGRRVLSSPPPLSEQSHQAGGWMRRRSGSRPS